MRRATLCLLFAAFAGACGGDAGTNSTLVDFIEARGNTSRDNPQPLGAIDHFERVAFNGAAMTWRGNWAEIIIRQPGRVRFWLIPQPPGEGIWNVCAEVETPWELYDAGSPACSRRDQTWEASIEGPDAVLLIHMRVFQEEPQPYILEIESLP